MRRASLNGLVPRTAQDSERRAGDWWEPPPPRQRAPVPWHVLLLIALALLAYMTI